jgi:hypothetical protein
MIKHVRNGMPSWQAARRNSETMRYVIIVAVLAGLVIWDGVNNGGQGVDTVLRAVRGLLRTFGI